jgi:hypothetical protein
VIEGSYLAVEAVALILVVVAVLAALSALVLERADVPARLATRLFWALLLVVWVAVRRPVIVPERDVAPRMEGPRVRAGVGGAALREARRLLEGGPQETVSNLRGRRAC